MQSKILVIDDDLEILELLKFTFESEYYQVLTASEGEQGLRFAFDEQPDIIILDVNMPKLSGFEICEKIRENGSTCLIPIIMLTSLTKTKDRITGIKLGADEYLSKPIETFELVARVEGLLRRTKDSLAANPLTGFPGNTSIEAEIKRRLESNNFFSVIYTDLDNFKSFNDKYGFERGDNVIRLNSVIIRSAIAELGNKDDFVGHIGGDDFVIVTSPDKVSAISEKIITTFDELVPNQYDEDVRKRGYLWGVDRLGQEVKFPLITISMGIAVVEIDKYKHYSQVVEKAKRMLAQAKVEHKSSFSMG